VKYLVDANVLLEVALRRQNWESAGKFLSGAPVEDLSISLFTLHSLGFFLIRRTPEVFDAMVADILNRKIAILGIEPSELSRVSRAASTHGLDFDDAFAYTLAEMHGLTIVSFDVDFDRTPRGRRTPEQVNELLRISES
jgi:uncharacterized protein